MADDDIDPSSGIPTPPLSPTRRLRTPDGAPDPGYLSPGARKEKMRQAHARPAVPRRRPARPTVEYPELRVASAFSFLDGASLPEDLVARAAELELPAVALVDRSGVYGAPRFYKAAKAAGVRALVGAEVPLAADPTLPFGIPAAGTVARQSGRGGSVAATPATLTSQRSGDAAAGAREAAAATSAPPPGPLPAAPRRRKSAPDGPSPVLTLPRLSLLVESRTGYRSLCRLLT